MLHLYPNSALSVLPAVYLGRGIAGWLFVKDPWQTHLTAALISMMPAMALRRLDIPPPNRYAWEDEKDDYDDE